MSSGTEPSLPLGLDEHQGVVAGQKVGEARVSSSGQNLDRQLDQLCGDIEGEDQRLDAAPSPAGGGVDLFHKGRPNAHLDAGAYG